MLHSILAEVQSLNTRVEAIEAKVGESHAFIQPKPQKTKAKKTKVEPVVQSSESKAHHDMKASLKAMSKAKQKDFTNAWLVLKKGSNYPTGTMPKHVYFPLQMQAFASVA
tara:strand:- start:265 stop:594 length:330 start_codon:yes stop_codon:yes gene_type:complete